MTGTLIERRDRGTTTTVNVEGGVGVVGEASATAGRRPGRHATRSVSASATSRFESEQAVLALTSLALGTVAAVASVSGLHTIAVCAGLFYALIGFGSALATWLPNISPVAMGAPLGFASCALVGFVLAEARWWALGRPVFLLLGVVSMARHAYVLTHPQRPEQDPAALPLRFARLPIRSRLSSPTMVTPSVVLCWAASGLGLLLCVASSAAVFDLVPTASAAFLGAVSPLWYGGLVLCAVSAVAALVKASDAAGPPIVVLALVGPISTALAYGQPHSAWAAKHIGVTLYVMQHGSVSPSIDLYQAWPGLFAGVGWVCHALGTTDVTGVARWWPPVIDVVALLTFRHLALKVLRDSRLAWIAGTLFALGNTIGQDYFSPQSAGYVLALGLFVLVYGSSRRRMRPRDWVAVFALALALAFTHQLSPYLVVGATTVLAVFGQIRSKLIPLVVLAPAALCAALNWDVIAQFMGSSQLGNIWKNILPQGYSSSSTGFHKDELIKLNSAAMALNALIIGALAVVALIQWRNRRAVMIALCAASGVGIFLANGYGNEGVFRVVLFALPWLAILAASSFVSIGRRRVRIAVGAVIPLFALYIFANIGLDDLRTVRPGDVAAIATFQDTAPKRAVLYTLGYGFAPTMSSANYPDFEYEYYSNIAGLQGHLGARASYKLLMEDVATSPSRELAGRPVYVLAATQPAIALDEVGMATQDQYWKLADQIAASGRWEVVVRQDGDALFRLREARPHTAGGGSAAAHGSANRPVSGAGR